jgi:hypothetical protein
MEMTTELVIGGLVVLAVVVWVVKNRNSGGNSGNGTGGSGGKNDGSNQNLK